MKRNLYVPWLVIFYLSLKLTTNVHAVRLPDPDYGVIRRIDTPSFHRMDQLCTQQSQGPFPSFHLTQHTNALLPRRMQTSHSRSLRLIRQRSSPFRPRPCPMPCPVRRGTVRSISVPRRGWAKRWRLTRRLWRRYIPISLLLNPHGD